MDRFRGRDLAVYAVWVPMSEAVEADVVRALPRMPDARVRHYWDPNNDLGDAFQRVLGTPAEAWDVYMLYPPGVSWDATPPKPLYWMHQLTAFKSGERLNGDKLAQQVAALLH